MTPEQLEAHRVRFEQKYTACSGTLTYAVKSAREGTGYASELVGLQDAWEGYQWALADTDYAQRAAHEVQGSEPEKWIIDPHDMEQGYILNPAWLSLHGLTAKEAISQQTQPVQAEEAAFESTVSIGVTTPAMYGNKPPQQSAQPVAEHIHEAALFLHGQQIKDDYRTLNTLLGKLRSWPDLMKMPEADIDRLQAMRDRFESLSSAAAQPVAWARAISGVLQNPLFTVAPSLDGYHADWYVVPLYTAAQPVEPTQGQIDRAKSASGSEQTPFEAGCEVLQYLREQGAPYYYTHRMLTCLHDKNEDEPKYRAAREHLVEKLREKCAALVAAAAQPVEVQPDYVPLPKTVEQARAMALVSTNWLQAHAPQELMAQSVQNKSPYHGCLRCDTPKKCEIYGCSPLAWPAG